MKYLLAIFIIFFFSAPVFGRRIKGFEGFDNSSNSPPGLFKTTLMNDVSGLVNECYAENPELLNYIFNDGVLGRLFKAGEVPSEYYFRALHMFMGQFSYLGMIHTDIFKKIDPLLKKGNVRGALSEYRKQVIDKVLSGSRDVFKREDLEKLSFSDLMALDFIALHLSKGTYQSFFEKVIKISAETEDGIYSYLKEQPYYEKFKEKSAEIGLSENFDSPGMKFEVQYSASQEKVKSMKDILQRIKYHLPSVDKENDPYRLMYFLSEVKKNDSLRKSFRKKWEQKVGDRYISNLSPEEIHNLVGELIEITKAEIINGDSSVDKPKVTDILITLAEFYYADETIEERTQLADEGLNLPQILKETQGYWTKIGGLLHGILTGKIYNKYIAPIIKDKKQVQRLFLPTGAVEGKLEFELTDRRLEDLMRGWIGGTCEKDAHFYDTLAHLIDPATLVFKIKEGGKFVGHMICVVAKDSETQEAVLVVDSIQIRDGHPIANKPGNFVDKFLEKLEGYARSVGFKKIVFANKEWAISNKSKSLGRAILSVLEKKKKDPGSIFELVTPGSSAKERYPKLTAFTKGEGEDSLDEHLNDFGFPPRYYHYFQIYYDGGLDDIDNNVNNNFDIGVLAPEDANVFDDMPPELVEDMNIFRGLMEMLHH